VEALVGSAAVADFTLERSLMRKLTSVLKTPREDIPARVEELVAQVKNLERQVSKAKQAASGARVPELAATVREGRVSSVVQMVSDVSSADELRALVQGVLATFSVQPALVALGADIEGRATVVVGANPPAVSAGAHSGDLVKAASAFMGGGGGGKPALAQGGGPDGDKLAGALKALSAEVDRL
jgi:alanyl-tRNA synthetase